MNEYLEMNEDDIIFKEISTDDPDIVNSTFAFYGYEGNSLTAAFFTHSEAYYDAAVCVYDKCVKNLSKPYLADELIYPMCFLYRHWLELFLKYLYFKYSGKTVTDLKTFLNKNHNLKKLWMEVKPILSVSKKRMDCKVNIGCVSKYIDQVDDFDEGSFNMRYPIDKDLNPLHGVMRLDYIGMHDAFMRLHDALRTIDYEIDNQFVSNIEEQKVIEFRDRFKRNNECIEDYIRYLKQSQAGKSKNTDSGHNFFDQNNHCLPIEMLKDRQYIMNLDVEVRIVLECIIYASQQITTGALRLPKASRVAADDFVKSCVDYMNYRGFIFEDELTEGLTFVSLASDSQIFYLERALDVLKWL